MTRNRFRTSVLSAAAVCAAFAVGAAVSPSLAGDDEPVGGMSTEELMARWQAYATPGPAHRHLAQAVGEWRVTSVMWEYPGADPQENTATAVVEPMLDGRYFTETYTGQVDMGEGEAVPFNGHSLFGYDNLTEKYFYVWVDSFMTGFITGHGTSTDGGKTTTYYADNAPNPITGEHERMKSIGREVSKDRRQMEMYKQAPDGSWWKHMEFEYNRVK